MTDEEIKICLARMAGGKTSDVMNFDYAGTLKYICNLEKENRKLKEYLEDEKIISKAEHNAQMDWFEQCCKLNSENAELRARLNKAVELPRIEISQYDENDTLLYYIENGHIQQECFNNKFPEQLQKRLAELKAKK